MLRAAGDRDRKSAGLRVSEIDRVEGEDIVGLDPAVCPFQEADDARVLHFSSEILPDGNALACESGNAPQRRVIKAGHLR